MFPKSAAIAVSATLILASLAVAQPSGFSEPAELPPASFAGQQYVDSKGCVFLRAGLGGRVTWVPRVTADRKQLCNPPVAVTETVPDIEPAPAVASAAPAKAAPVAVASHPTTTTRKLRKSVAPAPVPATPKGLRMACPAATPFLERLISASGDSKLYCTRGDGTVDGATLPRIIETGKVVGYLADATIVPPSRSLPPVPKGYIRAWKDDRLNTARAQTTTAGTAAQDRVWTREVPSKGVAGDAAVAPVKGPVRAPAKAASGAIYVQVGSFAVASNAEGAADRLSSLGLPVARKGGRVNGRAVQVVYAGPFASVSDAQAALSAARRAGFADAFVPR